VNTPARSHSRNRAWIALELPNRYFGRARHWQPVRSTYTMAPNTSRGGFGGRPAPGLRRYARSVERCRAGINLETAVVIAAKQRRSRIGAAFRVIPATAEQFQTGDRPPLKLFSRNSDFVRLAAVNRGF
jgi:hypothetical protein